MGALQRIASVRALSASCSGGKLAVAAFFVPSTHPIYWPAGQHVLSQLALRTVAGAAQLDECIVRLLRVEWGHLL